MHNYKPWLITNCEQCEDWEDVYFCIHCKKFYCTHCLIEHKDGLKCPSDENHEVYKVTDLANSEKKKLINEAQRFEEFESEINSMIEKILVLDRKCEELKKFRIFGCFEIKKSLSDILGRIREIVSNVESMYKNAQSSVPSKINHAFRSLNNTNYISWNEKLSDILNDIKIGNFKIEEIESEIADLEKRVINMQEELVQTASILRDDLWDQEFIIEKHRLDQKKVLVMTTKRLLLIKKKKIKEQAKLSEISTATTKKSIIFTGIVISLGFNNREFRIPCRGYDCLEIMEKIEHSRTLGARINDLENDIDLSNIVQAVNKVIESATNAKDKLVSIIGESFKKDLNKLLGRFYYSGNRIPNNVDETLNDNLPFRPLNTVKKTPSTFIMNNDNRRKNMLVEATLKRKIGDSLSREEVIEKLEALREYLKKQIDSGNLNPNIFKLYKDVTEAMNKLNGKSEDNYDLDLDDDDDGLLEL